MCIILDVQYGSSFYLSKSKNGKVNESKNVSVLILIFKKYFYTSLYISLSIPDDKPDEWSKKKQV